MPMPEKKCPVGDVLSRLPATVAELVPAQPRLSAPQDG